MIKYVSGNIFESDADCIFNTVNCEGYMGKGIAYQFKQRFPSNNKEYVEFCKSGRLKPGILLPYVEKDKTIINFPTKDKWRKPSEMKYIIDGLDAFVRLIPDLKVKKAAIPPLGCGNGGLNWEDVKVVIEDKLGKCDLEIEVYQPGIRTTGGVQRETMTVYDLLLLRVKEELKRPTKLRFQRTLFFANYYCGKDLYSFSRGTQGPFSTDLEQDAKKIGSYQNNNRLSNAADTYKSIYQLICSKKVDEQYKKLLVPIDKAIELVNSIENDLLLEGIATALYLIQAENVSTRTEICKAFNDWSGDKAARYNEDAIMKCLEKLESLGMVQRNLFDEYQVV